MWISSHRTRRWVSSSKKRRNGRLGLYRTERPTNRLLRFSVEARGSSAWFQNCRLVTLSAKGKGISSCPSFCRCQGSSCEKFGLNPPRAQDNEFSLRVAITRNTAKNQTNNALAVAGGFRHSSLNLLVGSAIRSQLFGHSEDGYVGRD